MEEGVQEAGGEGGGIRGVGAAGTGPEGRDEGVDRGDANTVRAVDAVDWDAAEVAR